MKKEYIVELREEEADELMEEHWVGELVRCKDCKHWDADEHECNIKAKMKEYVMRYENEVLQLLPDKMQELVRCKDCVHWIPGTITDKSDFIQPRCRRNGGGWSSDDYCSCAEKRADEI